MQSGNDESRFVPSLTAGLQVADGQADGPPGQARVQQRRAAGKVKVKVKVERPREVLYGLGETLF